MEKSSQGNKERILHVATMLFAELGYENVTMRQIAQNVGIKASSIYNHYESKESILEAIFDYFRGNIEQESLAPLCREDKLLNENLEAFFRKNIMQSMESFKDSKISNIIQVIRNEQFVNEKCRTFMYEIFIEKPLETLEDLFSTLIEAGRINALDAKFLAEEYRAFSVYLFYRNSLKQDNPQENIGDDMKRLEAHIKFFLDAIRKQS